MMRSWRLTLLTALALGSGCVHVQLPAARITSGLERQGLTWQGAAREALARHPDLLKARAELDAKARNRNQALGAFLPSVEGSLNRKRSRTTSSPMTDSLALDLDVSQTLFSGGKLTGEAIQAWREWEAARWATVEASAAVRQSLRNAFVELLRLDQLLEVNRRIAQRRQENAEMLRLRYEAGREHEGSRDRAQAIAGQAAFTVRQTQRRIESQSLALGRQLGGDFSVPIPLAETLETLLPSEPQPPADYAALADATPTVQRLTRSAEALKAALLASQAELWPTIEATFNYGYSGTSVSDLKDSASIGATVSVPLFQGGRNVQGVLESNATYRAAVEAARSARDAQIAELSSRWVAFRDAWELVAVRRDFLAAARKRAEIIRAQYTTGLATFQDFDIAEQELADSEQAYVQSLSDVLAREADWMAAQGKTLEEVLNAKS